jgi:hypothetical protein
VLKLIEGYEGSEEVKESQEKGRRFAKLGT